MKCGHSTDSRVWLTHFVALRLRGSGLFASGSNGRYRQRKLSFCVFCLFIFLSHQSFCRYLRCEQPQMLGRFWIDCCQLTVRVVCQAGSELRSVVARSMGRQKNWCDRKERLPLRFAIRIEHTRRFPFFNLLCFNLLRDLGCIHFATERVAEQNG